LKIIPVGRLSDESLLGLQIVAAKASSYRKSYFRSVSGFFKLKKILNANI
jgi:hypothetical protein